MSSWPLARNLPWQMSSAAWLAYQMAFRVCTVSLQRVAGLHHDLESRVAGLEGRERGRQGRCHQHPPPDLYDSSLNPLQDYDEEVWGILKHQLFE